MTPQPASAGAPRTGRGRERVNEPGAGEGPPSRRATSTSSFGVSKRENHDSSDFYARFTPPTLSTDDTVNLPGPVNWIHHGDARAPESADRLKPGSIALVVTSPPYFAGKAYEEELGHGHIPGDYLDYLQMLRDVFAMCVEKLEPGGRIAVNVANLGRKPYRSLSADVIRILQDDLGLLLRGEIIWRKAEGASGNCAWGSFQSASNPSLRDLTERIVVASKGRFDRALDRTKRTSRGLPSSNTILKDDFMDWTTDVWSMGTESAQRVGHPAPYPVELPQRLIELLTYEGDVVLDPFMGSGTTAVAAVRTGRRYVGFDTDGDYVRAATERVEAELDQRDAGVVPEGRRPWKVVAPPSAPHGRTGRAARTDLLEPARSERWSAKDLAQRALTDAGFTITNLDRSGSPKTVRLRQGAEVAFAATDRAGNRWLFDLAGTFSRGSDRAGLRTTDAVYRALGKAAVIAGAETDPFRLVVLTTELPPRGQPAAAALKAARGAGPVFDVVDLLDPDACARLARYARSGPGRGPVGELYPPAGR
jgi:site-specific DNA-methyltransferase (adenine-specific)